MKFEYIISLVIVTLIWCCSTPYQPYGALGGYESKLIGENTYKVIFKGNQHTQAKTVFEYLERRCAEITVENGFNYFIVFEDSSYVDSIVFEEGPEIDDTIYEHRKDNYLLDRQHALDTDPRQTLNDQKTKIDRTYRHSFIDTKSTNVVGILKIQLSKEPRNGYEDQYLYAKQILEKYKTE